MADSVWPAGGTCGARCPSTQSRHAADATSALAVAASDGGSPATRMAGAAMAAAPSTATPSLTDIA